MNITVYLGAREGNNPRYKEETALLGQWIGENGHTLVYGGGRVGLMKILADSVLKHGGRVTGVIPGFMVRAGRKHAGLTKTYVTDTMRERRAKMIELGDIYIAMPGGVGTLDEISEVISDQRLGLHHSFCVFYNCEGYYEPIKQMLENMIRAEFLYRENPERILFAETMPELTKILEEAQNEI